MTEVQFKLEEHQIPYKESRPDLKINEDAPIRHFQISIEKEVSSDRLEFSVRKIKEFGDGEKSILTYAEEVAQAHNFLPMDQRSAFDISIVFDWIGSFFTAKPTLYDIDDLGDKPLWIILELDKRINWEFSPSTLGVSSKQEYVDENYGLHYVFKRKGIAGCLTDGSSNQTIGVPDYTTTQDRCEIIFWAITKRKKGVPREFNFYISFYKDLGGGVIKRLPVIFDPNVPNTGGAEIPG